MTYATYDSYKESGVAWLGKVPAGWEVVKITHGFNLVGSGTTPRSDNLDYYDGEIPWVTTSELRENVIYDTRKKLTEKAITDHASLPLYDEGALLIAMYGATIGRLGILGVRATVNQACCVFDKPKSFDTRFVFWWLQMAKPILISEASGGGQPNLSQDLLRQLKLPIPSIAEQKAIAEFLDNKMAQIDALIAKKKNLLKLLAEQRTALITNTVTRGLDKSAPMKESGITWLGKVPNHWEVKKTRRFISYKKGKATKPEEASGNGFPLLSMEYLRGGEESDLIVPTLKDVIAQDGDILLLWDGANAGEFLKSKSGVLSATLAKVFLNEKIHSDYIYYAFKASEDVLKHNNIGMGVPHVNGNAFKELSYPIPPLAEQKAIADFLDCKTAEIDATKDRITTAIDTLKEYRTALITNAVTGKIDVRHTAK